MPSDVHTGRPSDHTEPGAADDLPGRVADGLTDHQQVVGPPTRPRRSGLRRHERDDIPRLAVGLGEAGDLPERRPSEGHAVPLDVHLPGGDSGRRRPHRPCRGEGGHHHPAGGGGPAVAEGPLQGALVVLREQDDGVRGEVLDGGHEVTLSPVRFSLSSTLPGCLYDPSRGRSQLHGAARMVRTAFKPCLIRVPASRIAGTLTRQRVRLTENNFIYKGAIVAISSPLGKPIGTLCRSE